MGVPGFGRGDADKWARHVPAFCAQARPLEEARPGEALGRTDDGIGGLPGIRAQRCPCSPHPCPACHAAHAGRRASRRGRPSAPPRAPQDLEEKERPMISGVRGLPFLVPACAAGIRETQPRLLCQRVASDRGCVTGESLWGSPRSAVLGGNQGQTPQQQAGHVCISRAPSLKSKADACKTGQKRGVRGTNIPLSKEAGCVSWGIQPPSTPTVSSPHPQGVLRLS